MKTNTEFRELAWKRLWSDKWFGRLFGGGILLTLCGYAANVVIGGILGRLGVDDWQTYYEIVRLNRQDLTTPVPNLTGAYIFQTTSATVLEMFIGYIMASIAAYGSAVILLKCLKNEENGWLGEAFGGFKDPFGMLWLMIRYVLIFLGWFFLAIFPVGLCVSIFISAGLFESPIVCGCFVALALCYAIPISCVPVYRYRFLFLVKAEHPDWSAGACIRSCKALMEGFKWRSFQLDCSYWKPIALPLLALIFFSCGLALAVVFKDSTAVAVLIGLVSLLSLFAAIAGFVVIGQYIAVGQGFLYQGLKDEKTEHKERN